MTNIEKLEGKEHLYQAYPALTQSFDSIGALQPLPKSQLPLPDVIVRIVAGQMLSTKAANVIIARVEAEALMANTCYLYDLSSDTFRHCGLSRRKIRAISEFADSHRSDPARFHGWPELDYGTLRAEVSSFWGLSDWTAEMLAIFHFAHPDVFPEKDGSIIRVTEFVSSNLCNGFDPNAAAPHRTLLARYFWAALDMGIWDTKTA
jgi:DNA-3-methyladenine glycosylase II